MSAETSPADDLISPHWEIHNQTEFTLLRRYTEGSYQDHHGLQRSRATAQFVSSTTFMYGP